MTCCYCQHGELPYLLARLEGSRQKRSEIFEVLLYGIYYVLARFPARERSIPVFPRFLSKRSGTQLSLPVHLLPLKVRPSLGILSAHKHGLPFRVKQT